VDGTTKKEAGKREDETVPALPHFAPAAASEILGMMGAGDGIMKQKLPGTIMQKSRPAGWSTRSVCYTAHPLVIPFEFHPLSLFLLDVMCLFSFTRLAGLCSSRMGQDSGEFSGLSSVSAQMITLNRIHRNTGSPGRIDDS
jgi:hypothetical protein